METTVDEPKSYCVHSLGSRKQTNISKSINVLLLNKETSRGKSISSGIIYHINIMMGLTIMLSVIIASYISLINAI